MKANYDSSKLALAPNSTTGPMFVYGPTAELGKPDFPIRVGHEVSLRSALEKGVIGAVIRETDGNQFVGEIISLDTYYQDTLEGMQIGQTVRFGIEYIYSFTK
jgi:hypothetical protein